jgi:shikimate dehydrogenase
VLLGDPVAHSLSPRIHSAALAAAGIAGSYSARRVDAGGFAAAVEELRRGDVTGANVTMPHKARAFAAADVHDRAAAASGAVNTLLVHDGTLHGHNTDVSGLLRAWGGTALPGTGPVLVLGAGGAAAAAVTALREFEVHVSARDMTAARVLCRRSGSRPVVWGVPVPGAVVVNATPLGMAGESLPPEVSAAATGFVDFAYGPGSTPAIAEARSRGIPYIDGTQLLVAQAADAFEIWTGRPAPTAAMTRAAAGI